MALALYDRVQETTTTAGTGSITLLGAVPGYQSFAVVGNGNTCYYTIYDSAATTPAWEVGIGTYSTSGPTLARTTVLSNSNGNTSTITLSSTANTKTVWVDYPSEQAVYGNGTTITAPSGALLPVANGGTGVAVSTGANSVVLRDTNVNISANNTFNGITLTTSAAGTTIMTAASSFYQKLTGTTTQTYQLPDATTIPAGATYIFDNDSTGVMTIVNAASGAIDTVQPGSVDYIFLEANGTVAGSWSNYALIPDTYDFSGSTASFGNATITNAVWNGTIIASGYGGTGLTTFTGANNALYSTSSSALTAGTLPVAAGGSGATTLTGYVYGNGTSAMTASTSIPTSALTGTLAVANGGTGQTSFTSGYVLYGNGTGGLSSSANMTFNGTSLTLANDFTVNGIKIGKGPGSLSNNIFISQYPNTTVSGSGNIGIGGMFNLTSGILNQGFGTGSLNSLTTGNGNQAFGYGAGSAIASSASYNNLYGFGAGQYITGSYNTILGTYTGLTGVLSSGQSNYVVLADGNGSVKEYYDSNANAFLQGNYQTNQSTISVTQTIATGQNTMSAGPITISDGITVTLADGANWVIV